MCLAQPNTYNQDLEGAQQVSTTRPLQNPCCLLPKCTVQFTVCRTVGPSAAPPPLGLFCFCWHWDTGSYRHYDFMTFLCSYNTTCATSSAPSHPTQPHTHTPPVCCYGWPCTSTPWLPWHWRTMPAQSYATIREETGDLSPPAGDVRSIVPIIPSCQTTYHKCEGAVGPVGKKKKKHFWENCATTAGESYETCTSFPKNVFFLEQVL